MIFWLISINLFIRKLRRMESHLYRQQLERRRVDAEAGVQGERDQPLRRPGPLHQGPVQDPGHDQVDPREDRVGHSHQRE